MYVCTVSHRFQRSDPQVSSSEKGPIIVEHRRETPAGAGAGAGDELRSVDVLYLSCVLHLLPIPSPVQGSGFTVWISDIEEDHKETAATCWPVGVQHLAPEPEPDP